MLLTALALFLIVIITRNAPSFPFVLDSPTQWRRRKAWKCRSMVTYSVSSSGTAVDTETAVISSMNASERTRLLEEAIGFNQNAAIQLVDEANLLRSKNGTSQVALEVFWNDLLAWADQGDNVGTAATLPWWANIGFMARYSKRARRASLRRVLDLTSPYADDNDKDDKQENNESDEYRLSQRRRSLAVLIRSIAATAAKNQASEELAKLERKERRVPVIRDLEQQARRASQASIISADDRQSRLPPGLETPNYTVLATRNSFRGGKYEIRQYDPFTVCSVSMVQPRPVDATKTDAKVSFPTMGGASAFGALAGYLFGKNQQETAMKMTTPVLSSSDNSQMSFVLPSQYWTNPQAAPQPLQESGVSVESIEGEVRAVVMFGGYTSRKIIQQRSKQLLDSLREDPEWKVDGKVLLAQYNDPFTPPWKRLNEVSVKVIKR